MVFLFDLFDKMFEDIFKRLFGTSVDSSFVRALEILNT